MAQPSEQELLKILLPSLLDDFQCWFSRSLTLLENEEIDFLTNQQKIDLINEIKQAQQEVNVTQMLFQQTQVGVAASTLIPWHRLLGKCWRVSMRWRQEQCLSSQPKN
jgi:hypothetical protein